TTIGLLLMRLHEATGGQALIGGKDILAMTEKEFSQYQRKIQIIFQNPYASLNPRFTIGQILLEPMRIHGIGQNDAERKKMALELLERVSLPTQAYDRYPHEFSGGQRQRIAIARCLTLKPEISHDLSVVKYISDQVMVMNQGELVEIANSDQLYLHPQHEYTKKLLNAIPQGIV
ncbi:MAG: ATP-binding cassette domain-containing protein, partial [Hungatella sp.]